MRDFIRRLGLGKTVLLFSFLSVSLSLVVTLGVTLTMNSLDMDINLQAGLIISVFVTLSIATPMSWVMVRSFLKIDILEEEMRILASYDSLTGLLTKREFFDRAEYFQKIALRENLPYSLIIADLDNFKDINDEFGHLTGDQILEKLGKAIRDSLRESDLGCRFGGDEFLFFLPNTTTEQAKAFSDRLQRVINNTVNISSLKITLTASMGIASYPELQKGNIEDFIFAADAAMYMAKDSGGNQVKHKHIEHSLSEV
jgi:diguanylate cyclase (GGDEF)-like protein